MKITNWNCDGVNNKYSKLQNLAIDTDIVCISETKLLNTRNFFCPSNYNYIRKDRGGEHAGGGLIIMIKNNLQYKEIKVDFSIFGIEVQGIKVFKDGEYLNIFNV